MKSRDEYFEKLRQEKDELINNFPLDTSQWLVHTDFNDALNRLEQSYRRVDFVKGVNDVPKMQ